MTALGRSRSFNSSTSSATFDVAADFNVINIFGNKQNEHAGIWLTNMSVTAAEIIWFRPDATAATVAGNDCYPLRPGERAYVRKTDFISYIAESGTPRITFAGDMEGVVYS